MAKVPPTGQDVAGAHAPASVKFDVLFGLSVQGRELYSALFDGTAAGKVAVSRGSLRIDTAEGFGVRLPAAEEGGGSVTCERDHDQETAFLAKAGTTEATLYFQTKEGAVCLPWSLQTALELSTDLPPPPNPSSPLLTSRALLRPSTLRWRQVL